MPANEYNELRKRAEARTKTRPLESWGKMSLTELAEELELHKTELLVQCEDLTEALADAQLNRDLYRQLYDWGPVPYVMTDENGWIQGMNGAARSLLEVDEIYYSCSRKAFQAFVLEEETNRFHLFLRDAVASRQGSKCQITLVRKSSVYVDAIIHAVPAQNRKGLLLAVNDITRLREGEAWLSGQKEAFQAAMTGAPLQRSLAPLVRTAVQHFGGEARAAFYLANYETATLTHIVGMSDSYARSVDDFKIGHDSLACGVAAHAGEPVITPDVICDPRWKPWLWLAAEYRYRACWSFPVRTPGGPVLGTFALYFPEPREPKGRDYELVGVLTHTATVIISLYKEILERARAEQALRENKSRLEGFNEDLEREVTARTGELVESQNHLRALATQLSLAEQRERKRLAMELHDHLQQILVLGKLTIGQAKRSPHVSARENTLAKLDGLLGDALSYTRTLAADLSPPVLRDHGLAAGLKWLGESMRKHDLAVTVAVPEDESLKLSEDQTLLLFQSVRELLINASKHSGTGEAHVKMQLTESRLDITVCDNGAGFDLAAAAAAADASTASAGVSSKFGLFSIRERMNAIGGWFDIESAPGKGTSATVALPVKVKKVTSLKPPKEIVLSPAEQKVLDPIDGETSVRVLVVDDHAMVRQGLRAILETYADVQVVGIGDGKEALMAVERLHPHVILMDINMPNKNGIELTAEIKAKFPEVQIIGLSVNAGNENQRAMLKAGASMLITKEAAVEQLYGAIQDVMKPRQ